LTEDGDKAKYLSRDKLAFKEFTLYISLCQQKANDHFTSGHFCHAHCGAFQWPKPVLIRIHFKAQLARASLTLGVCVLVGMEGAGGITVLSMGEGMCLRVTLLRIKMKPDYLPSSV